MSPWWLVAIPVASWLGHLLLYQYGWAVDRAAVWTVVKIRAIQRWLNE